MRFKKVDQVNVKNKNVLIRVDYNVPIENGKVLENKRIVESLPTLKYLIENGAKIIILSHLGRPKGFDRQFSLLPVKEELEKLLELEVVFIEDFLIDGIKEKIDSLPYPSVIMFENVRFFKGEKEGDEGYVNKLLSFGEIYVNDGFAVSHRKEASIYHLPLKIKDRCAGFLLSKEIENLSKLNENPLKPYVFVVGGSKVSTKLTIIDNIMNNASTIIIGGALSFTFLKSQGFSVGKSLVEDDMMEECKKIFKIANEKMVNILLPLDFVVAKNLDGENRRVEKRESFENDDIGLDIGPLSIEIFKAALKNSKTIVWNGPMGYFENSLFENGTLEIGKAIAEETERGAFTVAGGGDSLLAIDKLNLSSSFSFISTGGGAMLEFLGGVEMPGIKVLQEE
ncbi:MAG: phosphoglycerate kinase [candidate division WOR-3 bacterium]